MPADFPVADYEAVHNKLSPLSIRAKEAYEQFAGAWNAVSYRYLAVTEYEIEFNESLKNHGSSPQPLERFKQEKQLFGFFSNGFSTFEAIFYGLFSIGALISPSIFPMTTPKDLQKISPSNTLVAMKKAFAGATIIQTIDTVFDDNAYIEWREVRNILTHRSAPGRVFYASFDESDAIPDLWKLNNLSLDSKLTPTKRRELTRLVTQLLSAIKNFTDTHL